MSIMATAPLLDRLGPRPRARPYNLFSVAEEIGGRWGAGVHLRPYPTMVPEGFNTCDDEGTYSVKGAGEERENRQFLPFAAYVADFCTSIGLVGEEWEIFKQQVDDVLLATESHAAERQLVHGVPVSGNPHLGDANLAQLGADGVGPTEGAALLENAIAGGTARAGVLHATPGIATMWAGEGLLEQDGDMLVTVANRTPVIVGSGYIGARPASKTAGAGELEWAFATGPIAAERGEFVPLSDDMSEVLDRELNDVVYRAERNILVEWDVVLQVGVLIDRGATP